jgi:hypothetical protein
LSNRKVVSVFGADLLHSPPAIRPEFASSQAIHVLPISRFALSQPD